MNLERQCNCQTVLVREKSDASNIVLNATDWANKGFKIDSKRFSTQVVQKLNRQPKDMWYTDQRGGGAQRDICKPVTNIIEYMTMNSTSMNKKEL